MTTTKKIKLRFTKKKQNFKLEESKPKFRPLRKEGFGPEGGGHHQGSTTAFGAGPQGRVFYEAATMIAESGVLGTEVPLEVLVSAIADAAMALAQGGPAGAQDQHRVGGPDPI